MIDSMHGDEEGDANRARSSALREGVRKSRWLRAAYRTSRRVRRRAAEALEITQLGFSRARIPSPQDDANVVVVSLTSFPARINHAWIPIETMFRQDQAPDRIVLVLSDDEFPSRDLPRKLVNQQRRGLEILWVTNKARSLNKLLPTRLAYPDATIVTVDDDAVYEPWTVSRLLRHSRQHPGTVIGHRGWTIEYDDGGLIPYDDWARASLDTPTEQVFLTGVGGILYPSGVLPIEVLTDVDLATRLCPTADDIWFWAVSRVAGVPLRCLGLDSHRLLRQQAHTPQLNTINRGEGQNDIQFARVMEYFGRPRPLSS